MNKINVLSSAVFTKIAAGEVVERPRSIVKELVENCLDAGAQSITIEIVDGGITSIKVTDDGCGIDKTQISKAFLPHATSKICVASDLDSISTLGFRGEALSSISAVARVTITSRTRLAQLSDFCCVDGGEQISAGECGGAFGTTVLVEDLFGKTPARKKFLGKPKSEETEITSLVSRLILANSDVSFKYIANNKVVFQSFGKGLKEAVRAVYGMETLNNLTEVEQKYDDLHIYGLVSRPGFSKYNRSYQTLIVGGRYVVDTDISYVVFSCYRDYLMTRQYPMYILFVDLPPDMVDVNIHPAKMQVRFAQQKRVWSAVRQAIESSLFGSAGAVEELRLHKAIKQGTGFDNASLDNAGNVDEKESVSDAGDSEFLSAGGIQADKQKLNSSSLFSDGIARQAGSVDGAETADRTNRTNSNVGTNSGEFTQDFAGNFDQSLGGIRSQMTLRERPFRSILGEFLQKNTQSSADYTVFSQKGAESEIENETDYKSSDLFSTTQIDAAQIDTASLITGANSTGFRIVGKLFDTYILLEIGHNFYMIDQHAAHERLLFDKLYEGAKNATLSTQALLIPYEFCLSIADAEMLDESDGQLKSCGIVIKKLDEQRYALTEIPHILIGFNESKFVGALTDMLGSKISAARFLREGIIQSACKAAIKGGDDLSDFEIEALLKLLASSNVVYCPHGRPIAINFGKNEVEKWFKRKL